MDFYRLFFNKKSVSRACIWRLRSFLLWSCVICFSVAGAESAELQSPATLVKNIQQGGYVLYLRHTASDRTKTDADTINLDDCSKQRNLSAEGRAQASAIGEAIRVLNIPIVTVTTSPYCRCVDTAQLAFERGEKSNDLRFTISTNKQETQQLADALKTMLATVPPAGTNTVLVAHSSNLREAAGLWPKPEGVMHVFKPLGEEGFEHLGRIAPDQWQALTRAE